MCEALVSIPNGKKEREKETEKYENTVKLIYNKYKLNKQIQLNKSQI
jgi:hypothetical protein